MIPAVHFLCGHSYDLHCIGDTDQFCPECENEIDALRKRQQSIQESANDHIEFERQLSNSKDGFGKVAQYFGRGLFTQIQMVGDISDARAANTGVLSLEDILGSDVLESVTI